MIIWLKCWTSVTKLIREGGKARTELNYWVGMEKGRECGSPQWKNSDPRGSGLRRGEQRAAQTWLETLKLVEFKMSGKWQFWVKRWSRIWSHNQVTEVTWCLTVSKIGYFFCCCCLFKYRMLFNSIQMAAGSKRWKVETWRKISEKYETEKVEQEIRTLTRDCIELTPKMTQEEEDEDSLTSSFEVEVWWKRL